MKTPSELQNLISEVAHAYPTAQLEYDPLPSGVCFFWVTVNERNFVLEYHPTQGVGVSENLPATPPFVGHDEAFDSLAAGIERFRSRLSEASKSHGASSVAA
jgi:hypothetical protein